MRNARRGVALSLYAVLLLCLGALLAAPAMGEETETVETTPPPVIEQGPAIAPPPASSSGSGSGGTVVGPPIEAESGSKQQGSKPKPDSSGQEETPGASGALPAPEPSELFQVPTIPTSSCATSGVPPVLAPIYQRAAAAYGL